MKFNIKDYHKFIEGKKTTPEPLNFKIPGYKPELYNRERIKSAVEGCLEDINDLENPFVGERYFSHEDCYKEFEKLRIKSNQLIKKWFEDVM